MTGPGTDHTYLNISSTSMEVVATNVPSDANTYTDPKRVLQFPMTFGQSFTDAYANVDGPASVTWSYTGHGTALSPLGTFTDLAKVVSTENDMVLWNTTPLHPLVIDDGTDVLVFVPANVGIGDHNAPAVQVYPSPCMDQLHVNAAGTADRVWPAPRHPLQPAALAQVNLLGGHPGRVARLQVCAAGRVLRCGAGLAGPQQIGLGSVLGPVGARRQALRDGQPH